MTMEKTKSSKAQAKVSKVMREFESGKLRSSSGELVTDREQAIAIALSEARAVEGKSFKKKRR